MSAPPPPTLDDARQLLVAAEELLARAIERSAAITEHGRKIDEHQVLTERVAYAATEARAARAVLEAVDDARAEKQSSDLFEATAAASVGDVVASLRDRLWLAADDLGIGEEAIDEAFTAPRRRLLRRLVAESAFRII